MMLARLMRQELSATIFQAMTRLKLARRNALAFQGFEQVSYAEIADVMGWKQLRVYGELAGLNARDWFPISRLSITRLILGVAVGTRYFSFL